MDRKRVFLLFLICLWSLPACRSPKPVPVAQTRQDILQTRQFLSSGGDVNERDEEGMTPLMVAARQDNYRVMEVLLDHGANLHLKDDYGRSALWHAFETDSFNTFKMLLAHGASVDFDIQKAAAAGGYKKGKFYRLAREHTLLESIRQTPGKLKLYDAYFSRFPHGDYSQTVRSVFEQQIAADFNQLDKSPEAIADFIQRYSRLGKQYYQVTATRLNIRESDSLNAPIRGEYLQGERFHAPVSRNGWLRTDRGWVSQLHVKALPREVPFVAQYLEKARGRLQRLRQAAASPPPSPQPKPAKSAKASEKSSTLNQELEAAEAEFEAIMASPTLSKLEGFIDKYKNRKAYHYLVDKAIEQYKSILFGDM